MVASNWLRKLGNSQAKVDPRVATTNNLKELLGAECPCCRAQLRGHSYQEFAAVIHAHEHREGLCAFLAALGAHDWLALSGFHEFDGLRDSLQLYALRCPTDELTVLVARNPSELFAANSLEVCEVLSSAETARWMRRLTTEKWVEFGG